MEDCIFCNIVNDKHNSGKIWESDNYVAFLDIMPNMLGMSLVVPKKHYDSDVFEMPNNDYLDLMKAAKSVSFLLKKALKINRVAMVMEGLGINHAHIKLYPLHGVGPEFKAIWAKDKIYFETYQGYISTQTGPIMDPNKIKELAYHIRKFN